MGRSIPHPSAPGSRRWNGACRIAVMAAPHACQAQKLTTALMATAMSAWGWQRCTSSITAMTFPGEQPPPEVAGVPVSTALQGRHAAREGREHPGRSTELPADGWRNAAKSDARPSWLMHNEFMPLKIATALRDQSRPGLPGGFFAFSAASGNLFASPTSHAPASCSHQACSPAVS